MSSFFVYCKNSFILPIKLAGSLLFLFRQFHRHRLQLPCLSGAGQLIQLRILHIIPHKGYRTIRKFLRNNISPGSGHGELPLLIFIGWVPTPLRNAVTVSHYGIITIETFICERIGYQIIPIRQFLYLPNLLIIVFFLFSQENSCSVLRSIQTTNSQTRRAYYFI